ncbi:NAD(P)H-quinone oxidoreductase [Paenibacillus anaericanus]|uniref:NAD(P)H-quinone oxidoreductase n=1 Tax=Paenibacillus anaericanus TaxID=170367 RepID=A0A433Y8E1_9BACL|nr:NAD(P)H-quinone oxidoreductase [Paenibacillus anaericanus]RUT45600.1 NAD(P)H-quinone oxidoreductase [Paenibacillus anaericanus]
MKCVVAKKPGGVEQLEVVELPKPTPAKGELLIQVHATALNRTDILMREGKTGYVANPIIGVEIAGTVVEVNGDSPFSIGDKVMGLVNGGAYAEYTVMPSDRAMMIPESFTFEEAAAIPEVFLTAYQTLIWIGQLQEHETVLIHAGASGVGTAAIQLAKKLCKAKVIVTAGSKEKLDFCQSLGADVLINYKEESFDTEVHRATDGKGVELILDFIGANYWAKNLASLKVEGRWVLIGILGGGTIEKVNLFDLMLKRVQLTGTLLTPRSDEYKARLTNEFITIVTPYFERGEIIPVVDKVYPLEKVGEAHTRMEENHNTGKIILQVQE